MFNLFYIILIIKLCAPVMGMTISFILDIYTTTFITANYHSIDLYFEHVFMQKENESKQTIVLS